ncbi:hypothetical protein LNP04_17170 [Chryseobacterium sp. C-71]|uniref:hypothetical protein n=1 Tax=Chryseobacterium sp. C-71 TaxID=2893882 RepID=UPI001E36C2E7|nr:hypothetical protein [Chryseobacterium sp. C-71]UFH31675.1 hypothetical protein LNP04_17170 [Chryseobacterium sp. C-71]
MKKLLLVAAFGAAGLVSASQENIKKVDVSFSSKTEIVGGFCTITIYRNNADGSQSVVRQLTSYESSEEACQGRAASIAGQLAIGISPSNVN